MYHTKEVLNFNKPMTNFEPKPQPAREDGELTPIRFGELSVGSKFVYGGCWLVKTGVYAAESDSKRDKTTYLFFKRDVVKSIKRTDEKSNEHTDEASFFYCPYIPVSPANGYGSLQPTNFIEPRVGYLDEKPRLQPKWNIIITPGFDIHRVEVVCDDGYRWEDVFTGNLDGYWRVPIRLKIITLDLVYDGGEIQLYFEGEKIWCKEFASWAGINTCTITIENVCLDNS